LEPNVVAMQSRIRTAAPGGIFARTKVRTLARFCYGITPEATRRA
jgi:hypothetical protein